MAVTRKNANTSSGIEPFFHRWLRAIFGADKMALRWRQMSGDEVCAGGGRRGGGGGRRNRPGGPKGDRAGGGDPSCGGGGGSALLPD
ncbi:hypothetical protein GWI33_017621 [Rhynchophorus ferrugineus]|uniref:Uncharacterized protein n=1 Tax=Rhynchophorus ferrugineus TaxID=354439 RepID=A0A834M7H7_RHYFE|nr:hypothetical protein GWI33_017621 [Rhynchophorus ferrugineus]